MNDAILFKGWWHMHVWHWLSAMVLHVITSTMEAGGDAQGIQRILTEYWDIGVMLVVASPAIPATTDDREGRVMIANTSMYSISNTTYTNWFRQPHAHADIYIYIYMVVI